VQRRSDELNERLKQMPVQDKGKAIVLAAARMGKSQYDLVRLVVKDVTKITTREQAQEIAQIWAPLLDLKPERFVEIAGNFLK
jgi:hypothetical protein